MTLQEMQREIIANRIRRNWPSATDLNKTTEGIAEEFGEWARACRERDKDKMLDALGDIIVYCLGGMEILEKDAQNILETIIIRNSTRAYKTFR